MEVEWMVQQYMRINRETLGWTQEQAEMMGCAIRWAVEARKKEEAQRKSNDGEKNLWRRCERRAQTSRR